MDTLTPVERSERMSRVRSKGTKPEMVVRRLVHSLGYRYRLHVPALPGRPDLTFRSRRAVIFIHGCFWHQHHCPAGNRMPKSRVAFWRRKLEGNVARDRRTNQKLRRMGWRVLTVWECELKAPKKLTRRIARFLSRDAGIGV
jgi:DNA mismatch endonuclease (patch repair protein)